MGRLLPLAALADARSRVTLALLVLVSLAVLGLERAGALRGLENAVVERRMAAAPREASGDVVFVAIDNRSLEEVGVWPWPRQVHAEIIQRLFDLGAAEVFLDIDFSAASNPASDAALAEVMETYGSAILLPAFRQAEGVGAAGDSANLPLAAFRDHAWTVSVNVAADADGRVRRFPWGQSIEGAEVASAASMIAGTFGPSGADFPINFAVRPETVPTFAAIDVLEGRLDAGRIEGRSVVFGAHAIELRDNMSVPVHGIIPGATLQILATETLLADIVPASLAAWPLLAAVSAMAIVAAISPVRRRPVRLLARFALVAALIEAAAFVLFAQEAMVVPTPALHLVLLAVALVSAARELDIRSWLLRIANIKISNNQELLGRIVTDSSDAILVVDSSGVILNMSYKAQRLFGIPKSTGPAELASLVPGELARAALSAMADFEERNAQQTEPRELVLPDAERTTYLEYTVTASRLQRLRRRSKSAEEIIVACIIARDVTQAREETQRAEEAARAKSRFLAMMSHEIRTPINGVLGMAETLAAMPLSPEHDECVAVIRSSGRSLLGIVNDILEISKLEQTARAAETGRFDLRETLEDVIALATPLAGAKGLRLHLRVAADVAPGRVGDEEGLRKIATNLIGNAIKFTEAGHVLAEVVPGAEEDRLTLRVTDTGSGIAEDELERIFDAFYQASGSVLGQSGGTGLGLAISRTLARQMGGDVVARSRPGAGSVFEANVTAARWTPTEPKREDAAAGRFAVVARDALERDILCEMVRVCGGEPVPCTAEEVAAAADLSGAILCDADAEGVDAAVCPVLRLGSPAGLAARRARDGEARAIRPLRLSRLHAWMRAPAPQGSGEQESDRDFEEALDGRDAAPRRILIVDDSATNRLVVKSLLKGRGFEFREAENGAEACDLRRSEEFSHVLMDLAMPVMDGLAATADIRDWEARTGVPPVPIIGLTAHASEEDRRACLEAGMGDVAAKPVSRAKLLSLLAADAAPAGEGAGKSAA